MAYFLTYADTNISTRFVLKLVEFTPFEPTSAWPWSCTREAPEVVFFPAPHITFIHKKAAISCCFRRMRRSYRQKISAQNRTWSLRSEMEVSSLPTLETPDLEFRLTLLTSISDGMQILMKKYWKNLQIFSVFIQWCVVPGSYTAIWGFYLSSIRLYVIFKLFIWITFFKYH